ncbi:MAG: hypothetical protein M1490_00035 [Candidatus Bathyarchaeota archaeon]|nr:hypothetical protein [Candidatus Bathyarchaeota archaeon]
MLIDITIILALLAITTPIAVAKGKKSVFLFVAAAFSWVLLFFSVFFDNPATIIINGNPPLTALFFESVFMMVTIVTEIGGMYELFRSH